MRNLLFAAVLLLAGCCTLNEDIVKQDRKNYETLAPRVRKLLAETDVYTPDQEQDIEDRLQAWDARTTIQMEALTDER